MQTEVEAVRAQNRRLVRIALATLAATFVAVGLVAASAAAEAAPAARAEGSDGAAVAFARRTGTGVADLYVVRADGRGLHRLTDGFDPAWSPDGRRLAFARDLPGIVGAPELFVMRADGSGVTQVTAFRRTDLEWRAASEPAWFPDGRRLVFALLHVRDGTSSSDLWTIGADGKGLRRLVGGPGDERSPALSSRGDLAFDRGGRIWVKRRGGAAVAVARGEAPAWAPDGSRLAFVRDGVVHTVRADGRGSRRVGRGGDPAWGPGDRLVVAVAGGLETVRTDGSGRRRLTRTPSLVHDVSPTWRPAVRRVASSSPAAGAIIVP